MRGSVPGGAAGHLTVFALAIVIGYYVIGQVHHALHTPLMSVTNAISGIIVSAPCCRSGTRDPERTLVTVLSTIAILLAAVNVFGGFA
ncbi:proton-translocating transhydrogenase family protein [Streptomyces sp. F001]|uniref:proton-translocating transhydrogenase family protein n=1 Tax=Streptomyces sp. F001 TaxID=1510026 RepID=UPI001F0DDB64|nr:proton-translocating transhydrogenase family protein [Streptomyces sp. F001]